MKEKSAGNTVLVVDAGGRGSVLVDKYAQSERVDRVIAAPGNDLMKLHTDKPVRIFPHIKTTSITEILDICESEQVGLVDVAQDNAIAAGLVDALVGKGIPAVGPKKEAGKIEWDKAWAREFGERHGLPQPSFKVCLSQQAGLDYLYSQPDQQWFVKAGGLAEGKGALPARNNDEAQERVREMVRFKDAGEVFLLEQWLSGDGNLSGEEFSTFALSDGAHYKIIGSAQDHKRTYNFDEGENTGSMGCNTPPLMLTPSVLRDVETVILDKTISGMQAEGRSYKGVLYLGGMIKKERERLTPYVIEFNARWGDPEAEAILPGILNDFFEVSMAVAQEDISNMQLQTDGKARVVVSGAARGYPVNYKGVKGKRIYGIDEARRMEGVRIYGAGVTEEAGKYYASGGRLFYVVGEGETVIDARGKAYEAMSHIYIDGNNLHYRTDIGWRDVQRLREGEMQ